jgi:DNA-directed RNA polymerase specialized sigma24 family protein
LILFDDDEQGFRAFVASVEPPLRRALMAQHGPDRGREAAAEALAFAWEHWSMVRLLANPPGYLYRVGQSRTQGRKHRPVFDRPVDESPWVEPGLVAAMASLSGQQRIAVFLVYGYDTAVAEVAELLGLRKATVHTHLRRGLASLRKSLSVEETGAMVMLRDQVVGRTARGPNDV